jgi:apolipoprotein N-acyltransferase
MVNFLAVLISSFLYAAAFPKWNFWFLSFIALVPFFVVLDQRRSSIRQAGYGMLWGAGMSIGMGYWLFPTLIYHYEVPFFRSVMFFTLCLVIPIGVIYAVFVLIYRFLRQDRFFFYGFVVPALWVLLEYVKESLSFLIPWGGIAVALVPFFPFIQAADIIGPYGILFVAVMVNALCFWFIKGRRREKTAMAESSTRRSRILAFMAHETLPLILIFLLIAVPSVYGLYRANVLNARISLEKEAGRMVPVTLVQGNFSTKERWSGMGFLQRTLSYLEMSQNGADGGPRVIVWPETTLNSAKEVNDAFFSKLMQAIGENALLISGGLNTDNLDKEVYNCIYFISGNGSLSRYDKHYLLPYTETSPFFDLLDTYYQAPDAFAAGRTAVSVETLTGLAGASVCMEILYSDFIRRSVKNGAGYLVNVSNDSWFGDSAMPYIHLNAARLRAIENRRFVLRASNSGISAVISPTGQIMDASGLFTKERVDGEFIQTNSLSVYSKYGEVMLYGAVMVLIAAFVQVIIRKN